MYRGEVEVSATNGGSLSEISCSSAILSVFLGRIKGRRIKGVRYFLGLTLFILHVESFLCRDQKG